MTLRYRDLEIFRAFMKAGTVTKTSQLLGISQPAVTLYLQQMEDMKGIRLFQREKRRLIPTREAEELLIEVEKLFKQMARIQEFADGLTHIVTGEIRLAANPTLASWAFPRTVKRLRKRYPKVSVLMDIGNAHDVIEWVSTGKSDLGLIHSPTEHPVLEAHPLAQTQLVCVMRPDHPLATRPTVTPRDLAPFPLIGNVNNAIAVKTDEAFRSQGVDRRLVVGVNMTTVALQMVIDGIGVAIVEPWAVSAGCPDLIARPFAPAITVTPRYVVKLGKNTSSTLLTDVAEIIRSEFRHLPATADSLTGAPRQ